MESSVDGAGVAEVSLPGTAHFGGGRPRSISSGTPPRQPPKLISFACTPASEGPSAADLEPITPARTTYDAIGGSRSRLRKARSLGGFSVSDVSGSQSSASPRPRTPLSPFSQEQLNNNQSTLGVGEIGAISNDSVLVGVGDRATAAATWNSTRHSPTNSPRASKRTSLIFSNLWGSTGSGGGFGRADFDDFTTRINTSAVASVAPMSSPGGRLGTGLTPSTMPRNTMSPAALANQTRLKNDLLKLMNDSSTADVTLIVGEDQVEFKSHRIMLVTRSEYFRRMFSPTSPAAMDSQGKIPVIDLMHLDPDAFRIVQRFLYVAEEEDEATSPTTNDWRLVLQCYRITEHLGIVERSPAYLSSFVSIFHRQANAATLSNPLPPPPPPTTTSRSSNRISFIASPLPMTSNAAASALRPPRDVETPRDVCRDMWIAAERYDLHQLLTTCARDFWRLFGADLYHPELRRKDDNSEQGGRELLGNLKLDTLVRVLNAVPPEMETPIGRFRVVRGWLMSRCSAEEIIGERRRRTSPTSAGFGQKGDVESPKECVDEEDDIDEEVEDVEDDDERVSPRRMEDYDDDDEGEVCEGDDAVGGEYPRMDREAEELEDESSVSPLQSHQTPGSSAAARKRESHISNATSVTAVSTGTSGNRRRPMSTYSAYNYAQIIAQGGGPPTTTNGKRISMQSTVTPRSTTPSFFNPYFSLLNDMHDDGAGAGRGPSSTSRSRIIANLNLTGISATDLAEEVEPSGLLSDRHLLSLYRAAALSKERTPLWMPVPCGFVGRKFINARPGGVVSIVAQNPSSSSSSSQVVPGSGARCVTYCHAEPFRATSGKVAWTVVPNSKDAIVGIGVSADVPASGGPRSLSDLSYHSNHHQNQPRSSTTANTSTISSIGAAMASLFSSTVSTTSTTAHSPLLFGGPGNRPNTPTPTAPSPLLGGDANPGNTGPLSPPPTFVGDDGGWTVYADGTLRVGPVFVGRLPKGITFTRGTPVTVRLDLDARTVGFEVGGVDCGVAFRNLPVGGGGGMYPSVVLGDGAHVTIGPFVRFG